MRAAIVTDFAVPPRPGEFPDPEPRPGYVEVRPIAVGIHRVVRSTASGAHYSSGDEVPFVIGVDGVALLPDGTRVFTGGAPEPLGTMAERTLVPEGFAVPVPDGLDSVRAAGLVNPAMSSWLPLVTRAELRPGATVLVLGATGVAGRLAVRIALHLGAGRVLAAGRNLEVLGELAADSRVTAVDLGASPDPLPSALADGVDVVIDYLWGEVAERTLDALRRRRGAARVQYAQVGALAGEAIRLDAPLLRSSNVTIFGSGLGSIEPAALMRELPRILAFLAADDTAIPLREVPLEDIGEAWDSPDRLVVTLPPASSAEPIAG